MLHKAWNSKGEMPYCFPRSSIKFQGHTGQNITDFDPNCAFPDNRPVAAFKSLRFALLIFRLTYPSLYWQSMVMFVCSIIRHWHHAKFATGHHCVSLISDIIANFAFFVHNATRGSCIKVTILVCDWCQAISSKSKRQMQAFRLCFPNIPHLCM